MLKRKRSDSAISNSSSSMRSSPSPLNVMNISDSCYSFSPVLRDINAVHLSSRTRKRFRDSRPSEAKIYEHTLSMLYSAQKPKQQPLCTQMAQMPVLAGNTAQRTSLHSFWTLPSRTSSSALGDTGALSSPLAIGYQAANCEDCEIQLVSADGDAMDIDMDISTQGNALDYACSKCQKLVCHRCAISNLGEDRRCLICAGKRTWVGGIGWIHQS